MITELLLLVNVVASITVKLFRDKFKVSDDPVIVPIALLEMEVILFPLRSIAAVH